MGREIEIILVVSEVRGARCRVYIHGRTYNEQGKSGSVDTPVLSLIRLTSREFDIPTALELRWLR